MNEKFDIYKMDDGSFFKENRLIFLYGEINARTSYEVCTRLKYLDYLDSEKEIVLEINSPGGCVSSGLAIIDTMNLINAPVKVLVCGMAASMAALICACATKGMRYALPHSTIMIHQPLGGISMSQATDIAIYADNIVKTKKVLNELLATATGQDIKQIELDTERDNYFTSAEAKEYGLIDHIVTKNNK